MKIEARRNALRHRGQTMRRVLAGVAMVGILAGLPALPVRADAPAIELYGTLPKTESFELSPNGEMFATVFTVGDKRLLGIMTASGKPLFSGDMGDTKLSGVEWAGDDFVIAFTHSTGKLYVENGEYLQAIVVDVKAGKAKPLLPPSADYLAAVFGHYGFAQEDGEWFAYIGVIPFEKGRDMQTSTFKQGYPNLYKANLKSGRLSLVTGGGPDRSWVLDEKGGVVARSEYNAQSRNWKIMPPNGTDALVSGTSDYGFGILGLGRTPGTILIDTGGADSRIVEIKMDSGAKEDILPGGTSLLFSPTTRLLIGAILPDGKNQMTVYEPTLEKRHASIKRAFKTGTLSIHSVSADLTKIVVYTEDNDLPGTWQFVDFKTGQANPVAESYPGIASAMVGPSKRFSYKAADGLGMDGILTLPPGGTGKNLPVVVIPHGGPESSDEPGFDPWAQVFASRGYAVFQPNFRGSGGYGVEFRNAGFGEWGRKMQSDISDGVAALAAEGIVDPKRACIVGGSYGGYAALAGVTVQQGLYRCAVSLGGVSDPADMLLKGARLGHGKDERRYWNSYLGASTPGGIPKEISPRMNAAKADAPILLVHGEKDTVVPPEQSKDMLNALRSAGKAVEFIELKDEDHWLSRSSTRLEWFKAMVAFVQKHNPV
jgi:dipeptidyl aminopeptidase/acylaminoacyl peptidase